MKERKKIVISISNESLTVMKRLGLSPEDIFSKGLHEVLRQKYHECSLVDDEEGEEELIYEDVLDFSESHAGVSKFITDEEDIINN